LFCARYALRLKQHRSIEKHEL